MMPCIVHRKALVVLALGGLAGACSAEEPLPRVEHAEEREHSEVRAGSVLAEYERRSPGEGARLSVHAQFMEVEGIPYETALDALDVWHPDWELDHDACRAEEYASDAGSRDDVRLDLLDVGTITMTSSSPAPLVLEPRRLPDLLSAFQGVVYGSEQGLDEPWKTTPLEPGALYRFEAAGAAGVDGFDVRIPAPDAVRVQVLVEGQVIDASGGAAVTRDDDVEIAWRPSDDGAAVFLDVTAGSAPGRARLTCRLEDDGRFVLPTDLLESFGARDDISVALRRAHTARVALEGFDEARVILSTVSHSLLSRL